jgi:hypothetical protein
MTVPAQRRARNPTNTRTSPPLGLDDYENNASPVEGEPHDEETQLTTGWGLQRQQEPSGGGGGRDDENRPPLGWNADDRNPSPEEGLRTL